jgi:hypothetical protein
MWRVQLVHPELLYLSGAAAIPLIIHLLRRRRLQVVRFPAVRYLHATARKRLVRTNLKYLLLLLLRMALIALLALILARPIIARGTGPRHAGPAAPAQPPIPGLPCGSRGTGPHSRRS